MSEHGDAPRYRPSVVDVDEWEYLPAEPCLLVDGLSSTGEPQVVTVEGGGYSVLPVYSSPEILAEACGPAQGYVQVSQKVLPDWQKQLGFGGILVDRALPPHFERAEFPDQPRQPRPLAVHPKTGEHVYLAPTRTLVTSEGAEVEMLVLGDGRRALRLFSSHAAFLEVYEEGKPFLYVPRSDVDELYSRLSADCVVVDMSLSDKQENDE